MAAVSRRYGPPDVVRVADAYRHVDAGHKNGSVVVTMS
jgi:hypothetical protein